MELPILKLTPDSSSYNLNQGSEYARTQLDGGEGRYRADKSGSAVTVPCTFTCDKLQYEYLMAFYRIVTKKGTLPFKVMLIGDSWDLQPYRAHFMGDDQAPIKLQSQMGFTYVVATTLEAVALNPGNPLFDQSVVDTYTVFQEQSLYALDLLTKLVNIDLPMSSPQE